MTSKCNNFLPALFRMCNNDDDDHRECITWADDGCSFWVSNIEQFARDILPIYYKHNNYASFVRQLNMYGFHRSTEPKGKVEPGVQMVEHFTQEYFRRGQEHLLKNIHRKTSKMASKSKAGRMMKDGASVREEAREREQRDRRLTMMQDDIEALKKNQMQLASTVQGLHQAYITLQVQAQKQAETINKMQLEMQLEMGLSAIKSEVSAVEHPFGGANQWGGQTSKLDRRRQQASAPQAAAPRMQQASGGQEQTSLVELAGVLGDDNDEMGQDMDDFGAMLGGMQDGGGMSFGGGGGFGGSAGFGAQSGFG